MSRHSVVLIDPVRTAIVTFGGSLKDVPTADLGAVAIKAALARSGLDPEEVGTVVMGNVIQRRGRVMRAMSPPTAAAG